MWSFVSFDVDCVLVGGLNLLRMKHALVRFWVDSDGLAIIRLTTCMILGAQDGSIMIEWLLAHALIIWVALPIQTISTRKQGSKGRDIYQRLEANWTSVERVLQRDIMVARGGGTS